MTLFEWIQTVASISTALGVVVAASQLWIAKKQAQSQFEDSLTTQYREILVCIPLEALLGKELEPAQIEKTLRGFYEYFDLTNEQVFLSKHHRIRRATWSNWLEGINQNLNRPGFRQAWQLLAPDLDGSFDDLRAMFSHNLAYPVKQSAGSQ